MSGYDEKNCSIMLKQVCESAAVDSSVENLGTARHSVGAKYFRPRLHLTRELRSTFPNRFDTEEYPIRPRLNIRCKKISN